MYFLEDIPLWNAQMYNSLVFIQCLHNICDIIISSKFFFTLLWHCCIQMNTSNYMCMNVGLLRELTWLASLTLPILIYKSWKTPWVGELNRCGDAQWFFLSTSHRSRQRMHMFADLRVVPSFYHYSKTFSTWWSLRSSRSLHKFP